MARIDEKKDYYRILQVHPTADITIIKRAYRTLMGEMGFHPDKGGDTAKAQEINEAYEVLSNAELRKEYDQLRQNYYSSSGRSNSFTETNIESENQILNSINEAESISQLDRAVSLAREGTRKFPQSARIWYKYANLLTFSNNLETSLPIFEKAISLDPSNTNIIVEYGDILARLNRTEQSIAQYQKAFDLDPLDHYVEMKLCISSAGYYLAKRQFNDCQKYTQRAMEIDPGNQIALIIEATRFNDSGAYSTDPKLAMSFYQQALKINFDNNVAKEVFDLDLRYLIEDNITKTEAVIHAKSNATQYIYLSKGIPILIGLFVWLFIATIPVGMTGMKFIVLGLWASSFSAIALRYFYGTRLLDDNMKRISAKMIGLAVISPLFLVPMALILLIPGIIFELMKAKYLADFIAGLAFACTIAYSGIYIGSRK